MLTTGEGRYLGPYRFRRAIVWALLGLALVSGLSFYKKSAMKRLAQESLKDLQVGHSKITKLFQASFYFFYDDQFQPGIRSFLGAASGSETGLLKEEPRVQRLEILSGNGELIYDSLRDLTGKGFPAQNLARMDNSSTLFSDQEVVADLGATEPVVYFRGFELRILLSSGQPGQQYSVLYYIDARNIRNQVLAGLLVSILLGLILWRSASTTVILRVVVGAKKSWRRFWRLRVKFLFTIVLINVLTAVIVFHTLSSLQTQERTDRIEKDSVLFSQFSTARIISDFTNYFYFYYGDRFLPEIKSTIASNENLLSVRIISRRNNTVLFDSEQALSKWSANDGNASASGNAGAGFQELVKANLPEDIEQQLRSRDLASRFLYRDGEKLLSVITNYHNESQSLFYVEYLFSFRSLAKSIRAIRTQILFDLIPSLGLSLLIAAVFAQLLISPIRRLVGALRSVTSGDFNVSVDVSSTDEIGELASAFNTMTSELKRKKELRKYLSESTYRQIVRAADGREGQLLGGTRVEATILFTDIRGFVSLCESMDAEEVTSLLNEYFSEMVDVVYKHGGEVDKFIGDAMLAVFYTSPEVRSIRPSEAGPGSSSATALQAIYCALEMRERLAEFNQRRRSMQKLEIETGVGISHGEIISGPIGAKDRMDFTVIGDVVNLASRIEKLSKTGRHTKIVFSHHVEERIRGLLDYVEHSKEKVRGKDEEVMIFELVGVRDIQRLVKNLQSRELSLRQRSIELLGQSGNLDALPFVIDALTDPDESIRVLAILALAKLAPLDHPDAIGALLDGVKNEKSEKILPTLISAFGRICSTRKVFELVPFLDSKNERIVANAVEALGQARDPAAADLILPKLYSRNNRIKANAAMALFAAGHVEVIDTLKPMLMHSDPLMRSSAAFAIGELTSIAEYGTLTKSWQSQDLEGRQAVKVFLAELQECVPMLVALLKDKDPSVRRQSVIALGKIKDKSAVLPLIDMVDPEFNSKELNRDIQEALRSIGSHKLVREVITRLT